MRKFLLTSLVFMLALSVKSDYYSYSVEKITMQVNDVWKRKDFTNIITLQMGSSIYGYVDQGYAKVIALSRGTGYVYRQLGGSKWDIYTFQVVDVINIELPGSIELQLNESYTYNPIITDREAKTTLTWTSSNPHVATINGNGTVTATAPGMTTITCTAANGVTAQSIVTVHPTLAKSVTLDQQSCELSVGETAKLAAVITPEKATNKAVKWLSSNENIAQVDDEGNVIAIAPGYCSIYAKVEDGSGKYGKCIIHVLGTANIKGDMDGDGNVTVTDAVKVIDIILERE